MRRSLGSLICAAGCERVSFPLLGPSQPHGLTKLGFGPAARVALDVGEVELELLGLLDGVDSPPSAGWVWLEVRAWTTREVVLLWTLAPEKKPITVNSAVGKQGLPTNKRKGKRALTNGRPPSAVANFPRSLTSSSTGDPSVAPLTRPFAMSSERLAKAGDATNGGLERTGRVVKRWVGGTGEESSWRGEQEGEFAHERSSEREKAGEVGAERVGSRSELLRETGARQPVPQPSRVAELESCPNVM